MNRDKPNRRQKQIKMVYPCRIKNSTSNGLAKQHLSSTKLAETTPYQPSMGLDNLPDVQAFIAELDALLC